jgi:hypothetical protein
MTKESPRLTQNWPKRTPNSPQTGPKLTQKRPKSDKKSALNRPQTDLKTDQKTFPKLAETGQKRPEAGKKPAQNSTKQLDKRSRPKTSTGEVEKVGAESWQRQSTKEVEKNRRKGDEKVDEISRRKSTKR